MPFGLHFGSLLAPISVSFFDSFPGALLERPRNVLGRIWGPFWLHFGSVLGLFWGSLRKVKIELSLKAGAHFHCPRGSENHCFLDLLSERPPEHHLEPLLGVLGSILARFWGPLGTLFSTIFRTFFRARFLRPKMSQRGGGIPSNKVPPLPLSSSPPEDLKTTFSYSLLVRKPSSLD